MKRIQRCSRISAGLFLLFILFTALIKWVDVQPIGPEGSSVGFAALNGAIAGGLGMHPFFYHLSGYFGILCILIALCVVALGAAQLFMRKSIRKVDRIILLLGAFYILVALVYLLFEFVIINYRPVILDEGLEASYPSSHTMLSVCIMATILPLCDRFFHRNRKMMKLCRTFSVLLMLLTVVGRFLSGVHWFTDILGSLILSAALVTLFYAAYQYAEYRWKE